MILEGFYETYIEDIEKIFKRFISLKIMAKVILPMNELNSSERLIFLIGPIIGAPFWHDDAIDIIQRLAPEINIACPTPFENVHERHINDNPLRVRYFVRYSDFWPEVEWQERYINIARENGCLMAWLPCQTDFDTDYNYARTTRSEIAEQIYLPGNFVVGAERGFQGADYIIYKLKKHRPQTIFSNTLEGTCIEAVRLAREVELKK